MGVKKNVTYESIERKKVYIVEKHYWGGLMTKEILGTFSCLEKARNRIKEIIKRNSFIEHDNGKLVKTFSYEGKPSSLEWSYHIMAYEMDADYDEVTFAKSIPYLQQESE